MIIDFSAHYISSTVGKMIAAAGKTFSYPPESDDPEERLRVMRKYGVDVQIVSQTTPILSGLGSMEATEICKASNDSIYQLASFRDHYSITF